MKSDFEKLIIARAYVKQLEKEIKQLKFDKGVQESEIQHLRHENKLLTKKVNDFEKLEAKYKTFIKRSPAERLAIKKDNQLESYKKGIKNARLKLKKCREANNKLCSLLAKERKSVSL